MPQSNSCRRYRLSCGLERSSLCYSGADRKAVGFPHWHGTASAGTCGRAVAERAVAGSACASRGLLDEGE